MNHGLSAILDTTALGPIYNNCFSAIFEYVQNLSNFKPLVSTHLNLLPKVFNILIALAMLQYELHSNSLHIFGVTAQSQSVRYNKNPSTPKSNKPQNYS
jgi:hypothetical protein